MTMPFLVSRPILRSLTITASSHSALFSRTRRTQTEGAADQEDGNNEGSKPWARLTARLRSLGPSQTDQNSYRLRSQTPTAEMIRRHQHEDAEAERQNCPFLIEKVSRAASTASRRSGLRPPPRRLSSQSSRTDLGSSHLDSSSSKYSSSLMAPQTPQTPQNGFTPLSTPPNSAHPSTTKFSPPERIRRSWSGHREHPFVPKSPLAQLVNISAFAARPPGYTPESSETNSDYAPDIGSLFSVPEAPYVAPLAPPSTIDDDQYRPRRVPLPKSEFEYQPLPPADHPFTQGRKRERRGTFGSGDGHSKDEDMLAELERWR